jgi:hypothetical protein
VACAAHRTIADQAKQLCAASVLASPTFKHFKENVSVAYKFLIDEENPMDICGVGWDLILSRLLAARNVRVDSVKDLVHCEAVRYVSDWL